MRYQQVIEGTFLERPNRFIALVDIQGVTARCHVKNTGRCKELLVRGARVFLEKSSREGRKTLYDLIAVYKGDTLINMDSQAPNQAAEEYLPTLFPDHTLIKPECTHGDSRFDFYIEAPQRKIFLEVKGVTLEREGTALFPDAPTKRGTKHLQGLIKCLQEGYESYLLFIIQMKGIHVFKPNAETDPDFAHALKEAAEAGVQILSVDCTVTKDTMVPDQRIPIEI